jgi:SagB-type dehydrogenase family enzyme
MAAALQLPAKIVLGFVDSEVNALLDVDTGREVAFSMVTLGRMSSQPPSPPDEIPKLGFPTTPVSKSEVDYPELHEIHEASSLKTPEEVADWRIHSPSWARPPYRARASRPLSEGESDPIEQVILRRGSSRKFERKPVEIDQLLTILRASTQPIWPDYPLLNDIYLIINAVNGLAPGAYYFHNDTGELEQLKQGDFRSEARQLGLQQDLPGDAAADVFFLADLKAILDTFGNRGYRATQLEAGVVGGKMYLASYALHLGATGLTFFDDDVTAFFSPHAAGKSAIFLVALGKGRKVQ